MNKTVKRIAAVALVFAGLCAHGEYVFNGKAGRDAMSLDGSGNVSLACWVKINGAASGAFFNAQSASDANYSGFALYSIGTMCGFRVGKAGDGITYRTNPDCRYVEVETPHDNTWMHYVGVHDKTNGKISFYTNGILAAASTDVKSSITCGAICMNFRSGHGTIANTYYSSMSTWLAECHVYGRALTAAEAKNLYDGIYPVSTVKELVYWPLHQSSGAQALGFSWNGNDNNTTLAATSWTDDMTFPGSSNHVYDVATSSKRFTNGGSGVSGSVGLYVAGIPDWVTRYQVTAYGSGPDAADWVACASVGDIQPTISFTRPAVDADLAWTLHFANADGSVVESRPMRSLRYTATVIPVINYRPTVTNMLEADGINRVIKFSEYDLSPFSHGGGCSSNETAVSLGVPTAQRRIDYVSGPQADQDSDFNTFTVGTSGDYTLDFRLVNEAGNYNNANVALNLGCFDQKAYWVYENNTLNDGCFTFVAKVLNADAKTIQCGRLLVDSSYMPTKPVALDFSKPVHNGVDTDWKITAVDKVSGSDWGNGGVFMPHAWDWVPNSIVFHPDTTTIGTGSFAYGANTSTTGYWTNISTRVVLPAGVTSLNGLFANFKKLKEVELQAPGGVSIKSYSFNYAGALTNICGKLIGAIPTQTMRTLPLNCPLDLSLVTSLSNESLRDSSCPLVILGDLLTGWGAQFFNGQTYTNFPGGAFQSITYGLSGMFKCPNGVMTFPDCFTTMCDSGMAGSKGYGEVVMGTGFKSVPAAAFWNSSPSNITLKAAEITKLGARAFTSKNIRRVTFHGKPSASIMVDDNFLAGTSSDGKTKLMENMQMTIYVPLKCADAWKPYADGNQIPGTITKGTTQRIRYTSYLFQIIIR